MGFFKGLSLFFREMADYNKLIDPNNSDITELVFYSESAIYYQYYEGLIDELLQFSNIKICYITSDPNDPVFDKASDKFKPFYINTTLNSLIKVLNSKIIIFTMPDLDNFYIKRSNNPNVKHLYMFHGVGSTFLQYNREAFSHYDTIFCVGEHHYEEIQKSEQIYSQKPKELIKTGYYRLEKIYNYHKEYLTQNIDSKTSKQILIAPSWNKDSILDLKSCIEDIINQLDGSEYEVIIRPHPEFIKRKNKRVQEIAKLLKKSKNIKLELDMISGASIYSADLLITDWSSICYEYAFGTERPVLFINTPTRIDNPNYKEIGMEPIEFISRGELGKSLDVDKIVNIKNLIKELLSNREKYLEKIVAFREKYIYNWLSSSKVEAKYILDNLTKK